MGRDVKQRAFPLFVLSEASVIQEHIILIIRSIVIRNGKIV